MTTSPHPHPIQPSYSIPSSSIPSPSRHPSPRPHSLHHTPQCKRLPRLHGCRSMRVMLDPSRRGIDRCVPCCLKERMPGQPKRAEHANAGTTWAASQVWRRGVKAGLRPHDAGASGRQETRHSSTANRADLWSRTTPRPMMSHNQCDPSPPNDSHAWMIRVQSINTTPHTSRFGPALTQKRFFPRERLRLQ